MLGSGPETNHFAHIPVAKEMPSQHKSPDNHSVGTCDTSPFRAVEEATEFGNIAKLILAALHKITFHLVSVSSRLAPFSRRDTVLSKSETMCFFTFI